MSEGDWVPLSATTRYTGLRLMEGTAFTGHIPSCLAMCCRQLQFTGSSLVVAPESEVAVELDRMRKESASLTANEFVDCMPGSMRARIQDHRSTEPAAADDIIFDMQQNAGWASAGWTFPCMTKNNVLWGTALSRPILAKEHLLAHGHACFLCLTVHLCCSKSLS